jgi:hypothetical protein
LRSYFASVGQIISLIQRLLTTCFIVDQRLGLVLLAFFLFSHFRSEREKERFRARNIAALPPGARNPYEQTMDYGGTGIDF